MPAVVALASLSCGVTSQGARGILLGLLVPVACVAGVSALNGVLSAFAVSAVVWLVGVELADSIGSNLVGDENDINLWPFYVAAGLLVASSLGLLSRLVVEDVRDRRSAH